MSNDEHKEVLLEKELLSEAEIDELLDIEKINLMINNIVIASDRLI